VQFAVDIALPNDLVGRLDSGQVQAVVLDAAPPRRAYDVIELPHERVVAVCAFDHPLHMESVVSFADMVGHPLIVPPRGAALRRYLDDLLRRSDGDARPAQIVLETTSVLAALDGARAGLGIAFVPAHAATLVPDVAVLGVSGMALEQTWYLVRQRGAAPHRAMEALWNFIAASLQSQGTEGIEVVEEP
jgi:DNA-binding transcriptional LysR family regulator